MSLQLQLPSDALFSIYLSLIGVQNAAGALSSQAENLLSQLEDISPGLGKKFENEDNIPIVPKGFMEKLFVQTGDGHDLRARKSSANLRVMACGLSLLNILTVEY